MEVLKSKIFLGFLCFVLGSGAVLLAQKFIIKPEAKVAMIAPQASKNVDPLLDQFYNDDFFDRSHDPFEEMRKMRSRMMKDFDQPMGGGGLFDSWYRKRFGGGDAGEISKREDDKFVYYDISVKGLEQNKLDVKVENGQIEISGQVTQKSMSENSESQMSSSFHRSFPAPPNIDANKVQMEQEKGTLVIKFPKLSSGS